MDQMFTGNDEWLNGWIGVVREHNGADAGEAATQILTGATEMGLTVKQQSAEDRGFGIALVVPCLGGWPDCTPVVAHDKRGSIGWEVARLSKHKPFDGSAMKEQLWERLRTIPDLDDSKDSYPGVLFADLAAKDGVGSFLDALDWTSQKLRKFNT